MKKSNESCYNKMVKAGVVELFAPCKGMVGGDSSTRYLAYKCIGCIHLDKRCYCG